MTAAAREWLRRLTGLLRPGRSDADLEEELRAHLALAADERGPDAATSPTDRRAVALRAGGIDQAMEALRDQRGVPLVANVARDLREALRLFTRTPGIAAVAVVSLALSLALGLMVFRIVNAYVLRAMPYPAADRLYSVRLATADRPFIRGADALDWSSLDDIVEHRIAWDLDMFYLLGDEYPEPAPGAWITPGFVDGLGVRAILGRTIRPEDFAAAGSTPVMISQRLWATRFGADPGVLGRAVRAYVSDRPEEAEAFIVIGVLDPAFWHVNAYTDVVAPLRAPSEPYMLTLRPEVEGRLAVDRIRSLVTAGLPEVADDVRVDVTQVQARYIETVAPVLASFAVAVVLVMAIACANVAVLLLVRAVRRQHEMAIRLALGASRARLGRLLGAEAALIAVASTGVALGLSSLTLDAIAGPLEAHLGRRLPGGLDALAMDWRLAAALLLTGAAVAVVLTLAPLAGAALPALGPGLVSAGRGDTASRSARRVRAGLVALEVACALALLVGAALMIDSTRRLLDEDLGMRGNVITTSIGLRARAYPTPESRAAFFGQLQQQIVDRTGGRAAFAATWPLQPANAGGVSSGEDGAGTARAAIAAVSGDYFEVLGILLRDGMSFTADDRPGGAPVVVISESLAGRLWPDDRAVGRLLRVPVHDENGSLTERTVLRTVVGVAADVSQLSTDGRGPAADRDRLDVYVPFRQHAGRFAFLYASEDGLRGQGMEDTLRRTVAAIAPDAAVGTPRRLQDAIDEVLGRPRRLAWLLSVLALAATLLAMVGVYSVLAYAVRQREREIGVRLALGATPGHVVRLFVSEGSRLIAAGLIGGIGGALVIGRALETQRFGVRAVEPRLLFAAVALVTACGVIACWWPARRAAHIGAAEVLRGE